MDPFEVRSADGTAIAVTRRGSGPAIVLVHGIAGDASRWNVAERLGRHFTLYAMDRRGRGKSGDGPSYTLAREAEDIVAVLDAAGAAGEGAALLGHSFGGLLALMAANLAPVKRVLVYEPYVHAVPVPEWSPITRGFEALLDQPEVLLDRFVRMIVRMPDEDVARLRSGPTWAARVAAAHTIPREMGGVETHRFVVEGLVERKTPVRFLLGERSPDFLRDATARIHAMIPGSDVVELPGQGHIAMESAPELFEHEVTRFFE
jgi:pimeloyl-ACP methyl ester carboxylesterase